jgi:hypothetical protein
VVKIQAFYRRVLAVRKSRLERLQRNARITIQRVWRGYLGRSRTRKERDRYLFAKSQSQGIEFGRQMLLERHCRGAPLTWRTVQTIRVSLVGNLRAR